MKVILILFLLFSNLNSSNADVIEELPPQGIYPRKICPTIEDRYWNVIQVTKKRDLSINCSGKRFKPLNEYISDGSKCDLYSDHYICIDKKNKSQIKVCLGVAGVENFQPRYDLKTPCSRFPVKPLDELISPKNFKCYVKNHGVICFPNNYNAEITYGGKVNIKNIDCPKDSESLGAIDRVYCVYKQEVNECEEPAFISDYEGKKVCKEVRDYFIHIWPLGEIIIERMKLRNQIRKDKYE